jgi:hypothetical protein
MAMGRTHPIKTWAICDTVLAKRGENAAMETIIEIKVFCPASCYLLTML